MQSTVNLVHFLCVLTVLGLAAVIVLPRLRQPDQPENNLPFVGIKFEIRSTKLETNLKHKGSNDQNDRVPR